jgi:shikimate kinase/3-dehydroquinate synthase
MPHIFLYGPSGSGKTTIGKILAAALNLPFLDLDIEIEDSVRQSILNMMIEHGETFFRNIETNVLRSVSANNEKVIALGGGTLLSQENRVFAETIGRVVLLETDFPTLAARLQQDPNQRPLLTGELENNLSHQLVYRKAHYQSFVLRVDASRAPRQVVQDIQNLLGRYHLGSMEPGYDVVIQEGALDQIGEMMISRDLGGPALVISDTNTSPLYGEHVLKSLRRAGYASSQLVISAGEIHKNLDTISAIWHSCLEAELDRKSTIVALGGGVVSDLSGFAASTYMRGCNWVCVPTTLLAMVDASLGGKTGFDLPEGKNMVGAFHPPRLVLVDPNMLSTLPVRELRTGMAEVIKHGIIADPGLFTLCGQEWKVVTSRLPEIIQRGIAVKVKIIEEDPYERGIRAALNYGHTIGHAVELVSGFKLLHGEAVSIGMVAEAHLGERMMVTDPGLSRNLSETLSGLGLPVNIPENLDHAKIIKCMKMDKKKSGGNVKFTLPVRIGLVKVGVEITNLEESL